jgi:glycosyltransferase involved in cell wall biosynthesis
VRVTIVSQYFWPEQFRVNDLAVGLRARGHEVTVLTGQPSYPRRAAFVPRRRPSREWYEGVEVVRVPLASRGAGEPWRLALNYLTFAASASLLGPWRVPPADVVLVFQMSPVTMALPAYLLRRLRGVPVVLWVQDLWPHTLRATGAVRSESLLGLLDRLVRAAYRRSARVLAQSEDFLPLLRQAGVPAERLDYVPNWAEEHYRPVPADPAVRRDAGLPDGFVVMFAGNLGVAQSLDTVVDAAERLRDHPSPSPSPSPSPGSGSNLSPSPAPAPKPAPAPASTSAAAVTVTAGVLAGPPAAGAGGAGGSGAGAGPGGGAARHADLHWVVLGDGQRGDWLAAEVARRGLGGTVHLLGRAPVEQMAALFAHADVLVATLRGDPVWALTVPSRVQSFLACGRPVVAAADGTCARVVTAAGGLAVPAGDGTALAAAIATVRAMDPARRAEMGAVAREYYLKNFDRAALLDRIEGHLAHVAHAAQQADATHGPDATHGADATHGVHSVDAARVAAAARTRRPGRGSRAASAGRPR